MASLTQSNNSGETKQSPLIQSNKFDYDRMQTILTYSRKEWEENNCQMDVSDTIPTPQLWLNSEKKDPELARSRWKYTLWYRNEFGINDILTVPHPLYAIMTKYVPISYIGMTNDGLHPISLECFPKINLVALENLGISYPEILYHYMWYTEYGRQKIVDANTYNILDLNGGSIMMVRGRRKVLADILGLYFERHMPESTYKIDIINAPGWFNWVVYPLVKLIAKKETTDKINVFSTPNATFSEHLSQSITLKNVPEMYGGSLMLVDELEHNLKQKNLAEKVLMDCNMAMFTEEDLMERLN